MDRPSLDPALHEAALVGLARLQRISRSAVTILDALRPWALELDRPLRVLDVGCGGGDLLADLGRGARRSGLPLRLAGCDRSAFAVARTRRQAAAAGLDVLVTEHDVTDALPLDEDGSDFDVVLCSLLLHHLDEGDARGLLRRMATAARVGVLVHDLLRCRRGWILAWLGSRLLTRSPVVRADALLSVEGAFSADEVEALAREAGLSGARVACGWPARFLLRAPGRALPSGSATGTGRIPAEAAP